MNNVFLILLIFVKKIQSVTVGSIPKRVAIPINPVETDKEIVMRIMNVQGSLSAFKTIVGRDSEWELIAVA